MIVECATCPVRGLRCDDCVVTVLATISLAPPGGHPLDAAERRAVGSVSYTHLTLPTNREV